MFKQVVYLLTFCFFLISCQKDESLVHQPQDIINEPVAFNPGGLNENNILNHLQSTAGYFDIDSSVNEIRWDLAEALDVENYEQTVAYLPVIAISNQTVVDLVKVIVTGSNLELFLFSNSFSNNDVIETFTHFQKKMVDPTRRIFKAYNVSDTGVSSRGIYDCYVHVVITLEIYIVTLPDGSVAEKYVYNPTAEIICNSVFTNIEIVPVEDLSGSSCCTGGGGGGDGDPMDIHSSFSACTDSLGIDFGSNTAIASVWHSMCGCEGMALQLISQGILDEMSNIYGDNLDGNNCAFRCSKIYEYISLSSMIEEIKVPCSEDSPTLGDIISEIYSQKTDCTDISLNDATEYMDSTYDDYIFLNSLYDGIYENNVITSTSLANTFNSPGNQTASIHELGGFIGSEMDCNSDDIYKYVPAHIMCLAIDGNPYINCPSFRPTICSIFSEHEISSEEEFISVLNSLEMSPDVSELKDCIKTHILELIEDNPNILIDGCFQNGSIPDISDLASFIPSQEILDIIEDRGEGNWDLQTITDAKGATLNADYFWLEFQTLPTINGIQQSAEETFNYIQQNFQSFDDGCIPGTFNFTSLSIDEPNWLSSNPMGTMFDITIPTNDGTVITSQYDNSPNQCFCWTFTTVFTPDNEGNHPVSGNRQFGLFQESNGNWTFYTRGVDRVTANVLSGLFDAVGFFGADLLWNCIFNNVYDFLDDNSANPLEAKSENYRPKWEIVEDQILDLPLNDLLECIHSETVIR